MIQVLRKRALVYYPVWRNYTIGATGRLNVYIRDGFLDEHGGCFQVGDRQLRIEQVRRTSWFLSSMRITMFMLSNTETNHPDVIVGR
jgi:hypothetical protein